jgi:small conductance mechanosensitive channel
LTGVRALILAVEERSRTERIGDNLSDFARDDGLRIILVLLGTVIAVRVVRIVLYRIQRRVEKSRLAVRGAGEVGRLTALFDVLHYLAVAVVVGIGVMSVLAQLGVNAGALFASAGVLGFAVGFGAQTMVKDLLNGLFLLAEGQYTIGDEITIGGVTGTVERVTLRTTTLRATNGDVHIVPSGDVRLVTNKSKGWSQVTVDTGIGYTTPVERAIDVLEGYCAEVARDPAMAERLMDAPKVAGVQAFQDHQYIVRVTARLLPGVDVSPTERIMRRILRQVFEREGIEPPTPIRLMPIPAPLVPASEEVRPTAPPERIVKPQSPIPPSDGE